MKKNLRIIAAQINTTVGDIGGNTKKIIKCGTYARDLEKAKVIIFPEMALTGYPPEDLLLRSELYEQTKIAIKKIARAVKNIYIILGLPTKTKDQHFNSALVIYNGKTIAEYHKQLLPNFGVFDEKRYFTPGQKTTLINIQGIKIGLTICEDIWFKEPILQAKKMGAQLIISINSSPFDLSKSKLREKILFKRASETKLPIIYVNTCGGQDELVFDGGSLVIDHQGKIIQQAPFFKETLMPIDIEACGKLKIIPKSLDPKTNSVELAYQALVLGVRDYIEKNGFKRAIIGASGGIDSALTLAIAVDAVGRDRVLAVYLPSRFSSKLSAKTTQESFKLLGINNLTIPIEPAFKTFLKNLTKYQPKLTDITIQNIQARCRSIILMALANNTQAIVLSTGNKSELAVGYATLYGDMVGGFCVLKDVAKELVYKLAKYRNTISYVIPTTAITRAPTAELSKNQKDVDDLPPYPVLDEILKRYIELNQSPQKIIRAGFNKKTVNKVIKMIYHSEYKRRQAAPGVKITTQAFGRERRYPITTKFV